MYYITGCKGMRYRLLAGPYETAELARIDIDRAQEAAANYHNGIFNEITVDLIKDFNQPAALNLKGFKGEA
jgi:hypothetical protein